MVVRLKHFFPALLLVLLVFPVCGQDEGKEKARMLINLLDYIGRDYAVAVKDGEVVNEFEYKEMVEFVDKARGHYRDVLAVADIDTSGINKRFNALEKAVSDTAGVDRVGSIARELGERIRETGVVPLVPDEWPDLEKGEAVFAKHCANCHGEKGKGNGPSAQGLEPAPTDFTDRSHMERISPFQAYNTMRTGIPETSMRSFPELSEKESWAVAFYVNALPYPDKALGGKLPADILKKADLEKVSTSSDVALKERLGSQEKVAHARRGEPGEREGGQTDPVGIAIDHLESALTAYKKGQNKKASEHALNAYLDGVEPVEAQIRAADPARVDQLEKEMLAVRNGIDREVDPDSLAARVEKGVGTLKEVRAMLEEENHSFWSAGLISGSIILREGIEAFLIIVTILSVLRSVNADRARKWVHGGWISALLIGISGWFFVDALIAFGAQGREVMEGIGALTAVLILLVVGFWLHQKSSAEQWKKFVQERIHRSLNTNNMIGLAVMAFIVVFREAFESVIFLSSLKLELEKQAVSGLWSGVAIAGLLVAVLAWLAMRFSVRLPIQKLFLFSSIIILVLAVILTGKGIHSLQESGSIGATSALIDIRLPLLGIYPTVQSLLSQLGILVLIGVLWFSTMDRSEAGSGVSKG